MIQFPVYIEPMGAVRMTQRSKWTDINAQRYLSYKGVIAMEARKHVQEPLGGPLRVTLWFYYPIPDSWSKKKRRESEGQFATVKPDVDNCVKGVFDALNKVAWKDDNLVAELVTQKRYSCKPMIEIKIEELTA